MTLDILPSHLKGDIAAPPSKSMAHRYLLAAALSCGTSRITGISTSEDISATVDCLRLLGAKITLSGDVATVTGIDPRAAAPCESLNCRESGSTLRFLLPLGWLAKSPVTLSGSERLMERPLSVYDDLARSLGLGLSRGERTVSASGRLAGGEYSLRGDISSQFITGLLYALPFTDRDSVIRLLPPVESRSYLDLTIAALSRFGASVRFIDPYTIEIKATGCFRATDCHVEGDYSNAAFFEALTTLGHEVTVTGLAPASRQGDRVYRDYFSALSKGFATLSLADCPDLGPILMAVAAAKNGARFTSTRRLKIKESDRGAAMAEELEKLGVKVTLLEDEITVHPSRPTTPTTPLYGHNDHRIVMALSTLLTLVGGRITGCEAVRKSLPEYFELLTSLGCKVQAHENE